MNPHLPARFGRATIALAAAGLLLVGSFASVDAASPVAGSSSNSTTASAVHHFCVPEWTAAVAQPRIDRLRTVGDCEINRRFVTLDTLTRLVNGSDVLTSEHKVDLRDVNSTNPASFAAERTGLTALKASIDSDTTAAALRSDIAKIAPDYRVYLLVVPKTHLVVASDAAEKASARLGTLGTDLQNLINLAKADGRDVTKAQAALDEMNADVAQASGLLAPVAGTILPLSPSDWNNGTAGPALTAARATIHQSRTLLVDARQDAFRVIGLLGS
ncbi:MAG: hypothetical protein ACRDGQ_00350 [Candidatus Limnocylindrales bacterium]